MFAASQEMVYKIEELKLFDNAENDKPDNIYYNDGLVIIDDNVIGVYHNNEFIKYDVINVEEKETVIKIKALDGKYPLIIRMILMGNTVHIGFKYDSGFMTVKATEIYNENS